MKFGDIVLIFPGVVKIHQWLAKSALIHPRKGHFKAREPPSHKAREPLKAGAKSNWRWAEIVELKEEEEGKEAAQEVDWYYIGVATACVPSIVCTRSESSYIGPCCDR